ncbi:unnamed protein product [Closterium sp. NIES-53]
MPPHTMSARSGSHSQAHPSIPPFAIRNLPALLLFLVVAVSRSGTAFANTVDDSWYNRNVHYDPNHSAVPNAITPNGAQSSMDACLARNAPFVNDTIYPRPPFPTLCPSEGLFEVCYVKGPIAFNITPTFIGTRWKGWGTSLAWFGNYVGGLPNKRLNTLMDLIFKKEGLNFNIVRYNIGGGFNAHFSPQFLTGTATDWRGIPGFL